MKSPISLLLLGAVSLLSPFVSADTCQTLESKYPEIKVVYPGVKVFSKTQTEYWNKGCGQLIPTCLIFPISTQQVVNIVKVLQQNNETFAVKSGGHMPNTKFASVNGGPLVALQDMRQLEYDNSKKIIHVGPGNRWQHVAGETGKYGRAIVSGRMGHVGVPGLLLGGGLSFLSGEYGWASTHVDKYEVVLANGTVAEASRTLNKDLYTALQGGGGSYGIVTRFSLKTYPIGQIWGGVRLYSGDKTSRLLAAVRDFTENYPDPKAGIILTAETTLYGLAAVWVMFYFYNGPKPPQHVFENFTKIAHVSSSTKTQPYTDLLYSNNQFVLNGSYYTIATETLPLPLAENGVEVMTAVHNHWKTASAPISNKIFGAIASIAYQPVPRLISQQTQKHGGNVMDMDDDGHRIILEYDYSYINGYAENEVAVNKATKNLVGGTKEIIQKFIQEKKLPNIKTPLFMNDAYTSQDMWGRFGKTDFMKKVKRQVDPEGLFGTRTHTWEM